MKARQNPFRVERIESLLEFEPRWLGLDWEDILARLDQLPGHRGAIIGAHGTGKTTMLRALKPRLEDRRFDIIEVFLNDRHPFDRAESARLQSMLARSRENTCVLLDGCEQLGWLEWKRFQRLTRDTAGLIATMHRRGRLPVLIETRVDPPMLESFVERLDPEMQIDAPTLLHRNRGNARDALRACYDSAGGNETVELKKRRPVRSLPK